MIIRVTVNDNDFYSEIIGFMRKMWCIAEFKKPIEDMTTEELVAESKEFLRHRDIIKLINPNNDKKFTEEEKTKIIDYLRERFIEYINSTCREENTKKYLIEMLEIKIQQSFTDKWENGEAFYWLQHSNKIINQ